TYHCGGGWGFAAPGPGVPVLGPGGAAPPPHGGASGRAAAARNVRIYPASGYFVTRPPAEPTFLIGYAALPTARITEGVALLAAAVRESTAR
ncbi:PLP-dependent aminotransferase family protein, partial [Micromonospora chokoriensis]